MKMAYALRTFFFAGICALMGCSDDSSSSSPENSSNSQNPGIGNSSSSGTAAVTQMACSEIMYHHIDDLEWVEITISSGKDLESMATLELRLSGAVDYLFPDESLKKGEYIVVTNDVNLFKSTYPDFSGRLFGPWDNDSKTGLVGKLSNNGDVVSVKLKGTGDVDCSFDNDPPWPSLANGNGHSLVYIGGNAAIARSWAASKKLHGNPGSGDDSVYTAPSIRINEALPTDGREGAWIELYNFGENAADVSGWKILTKNSADTLTIPEGSSIQAGGYLVLDLPDDFVLMTRGENLYLREYQNGAWTYAETGLEYPAAPNSSVGVIESTDGQWIQGALTDITKGTANKTTLKMGPLYISEIYYNPVEMKLEFLEIVNKADTAVTLSQKINGKVGMWEINGIGDVALSDVTIPPNGLLVVIPDTTLVSPEQYAEGLPEGVIVRNYSGKISNRGERLVLKQPDSYTTSTTTATVDWHFRWSDAALYSDDGVWPKEADGAGMSLKRIDFMAPGSDPSAWEAAEPSPGIL